MNKINENKKKNKNNLCSYCKNGKKKTKNKTQDIKQTQTQRDCVPNNSLYHHFFYMYIVMTKHEIAKTIK